MSGIDPSNIDCTTCDGEGEIVTTESVCPDCDEPKTMCRACIRDGHHVIKSYQDCSTCEGKGYLTPLDRKYLRLEAIANQY